MTVPTSSAGDVARDMLTQLCDHALHLADFEPVLAALGQPVPTAGCPVLAPRGAVFALAGVLVVEAAITYQPAKAGGIDKALLTLRNQPFGEFLLILAALGLIIFGIYGLCEARWRKV